MWRLFLRRKKKRKNFFWFVGLLCGMRRCFLEESFCFLVYFLTIFTFVLAPDGRLLCPRRQSNQSAAGGKSENALAVLELRSSDMSVAHFPAPDPRLAACGGLGVGLWLSKDLSFNIKIVEKTYNAPFVSIFHKATKEAHLLIKTRLGVLAPSQRGLSRQ